MLMRLHWLALWKEGESWISWKCVMVDWKVREMNREDAKDTKEEKRGGSVYN